MNEVYILKSELNEWIAKYFRNDLVSIDDLLRVIEDLDGEIGYLKEQYENLKENVRDNYRPLTIREQVE